jgi:GxxExxY protein
MPYEQEIPPYGDLPEPPKEMDALARTVIGIGIEVHRELGPGLPEEAYEGAMCVEFDSRGILYERQKLVEIVYKGVVVARGRIDLLVEGKLIVEVKSCDTLIAVHRMQVIAYLKIIKQMLGLLMNFNVPVLKDGIRRVICS